MRVTTSDDDSERLSRIATRWSMLARAHEGGEQAASARETLLEQYSGAVYRYLRGALGDPEAAEELAHEFALKFLSGAFQKADPRRGRFRDYVRKSLIHLVNDYHRQRKRSPRLLGSGGPEPAVPPNESETEAEGEDFLGCLREEVLDRVWQALQRDYPRYHAILQMRVENPNMPSREIAEQLQPVWNKPLTAALVRKTIERARGKFAEALVDEVAVMTETGSRSELETELQRLDLFKYCRSVLERRA